MDFVDLVCTSALNPISVLFNLLNYQDGVWTL